MRKRIALVCATSVIFGVSACSSSSSPLSGSDDASESDSGDASPEQEGGSGNDATTTTQPDAGKDAGMDATMNEMDGATEDAADAAPDVVEDAGVTMIDAEPLDASNAGFDGSVPANCGAWTSFTATSLVAYVGDTITFGATAVGADPNNLGYTWAQSTTIGAFGQTADEAAGPTDAMSFMCTAPGTATISVTVDDGMADAATCPASLATTSTTVTCVAAPTAIVEAAWVEVGSTGSSVTDGGSPVGTNAAIARVITAAATCPTITLNGGSPQAMAQRVASGTIPVRPTSSTTLGAAFSKPSIFPVQTCELVLPSGTTSAVVNAALEGGAEGITLPLPKQNAQTIVVIADTGCRLQNGVPASTAQWQDCNVPSASSDTNAYTFAATAAAAAALHPDLVIHIGDYDYRDNECPPDMAGCAGSPWGYGWDTWQADFFSPAKPLLAAAPWVVNRGNHEQCTRSGQGWYRFLDTNGYDYVPNKDCNTEGTAADGGGFTNDNVGAYNTPYAVKVRDDTQFIVFDSNNVAKSAIAPTGANAFMYSQYEEEILQTAQLVQQGDVFNIWTNHHAILGFSNGPPLAAPGIALLSVMEALYPDTIFPPGINMALHGHTHLFEAIDYASTSTDGGVPNKYPSTFVSGNAGTQLDLDLPSTLPDGTSTPAPTALVPPDIDAIAHSPNFGFLVMQYQPADAGAGATWLLTEYKQDGTTIRTQCTATLAGHNTCTVNGDIQ
jgi:hypothetical protein